MIFNIFYYYFYLFYKKRWKDSNPHLTTVLSLSFLYSLLLNGVIDLFLASVYDFVLNKYYKMGVLLVIVVIMSIVYLKKGKGEIIVSKEKPVFHNKKISIIISIFLFFVGVLFLFLKADIIRIILNSR